MDEVHVMAVKPIQEGKYAILKCKGGAEYFAGNGAGLVAVADKIKGQDVAVEADPGKDGRSPALRKLVLKATGEVVYADEGKGGGRRGSPGGGYAKDPAERASIEAQSALSHSLQEVRMAGDWLLRIVEALAPLNAEGVATADAAHEWVMGKLESTVKGIADYRKATMEGLAASLSRTRLANMGPSGSGSQPGGLVAPTEPGAQSNRPSRPSGRPGGSLRGPGEEVSDGVGGTSTSGGDAARTSATDAEGRAGTGSPERSNPRPAETSEGGPGPDPDTSPSDDAALQAKVLAKFKTLKRIKAASALAFGTELTPGNMTTTQLEAMLSAEVEVPA